MSGDTVYPGGLDTAFGTQADYLAGDWDDIVGDGTNVTYDNFMQRVESGLIALETYGARVLGNRAGISRSNTSAEGTLLASTISVPANLLLAGSQLIIDAVGVVQINSNTGTALTLKAYLGGTSLFTPVTLPTGGATWTLSTTAHFWRMQLCITATTIGATAALITSGMQTVGISTTSDFDTDNGSNWRLSGAGAATVDTTGALAFDLKGTMSIANSGNVLAGSRCVVTHIPYIG